jgi:hypothetical protein
MTTQEFSDQFDLLYNNITSNQAPGLNDYEKSVFLTKAQDEIVKAYFNPKLNKAQEGFDDNAKRQIDFSMLVKTKSLTTFTAAVFDSRTNNKSISLEKDIMMILNEFADVKRGSNETSVRLTVVPIQYTEYARLMSKPFKRPTQYQAWRLINNDGSNKADLIIGTNDTLTKYIYRYVKRPQAIIIGTLEGVTIDSKATSQECELDPILHQEILQRAVELAKASFTGDLNSQLSLGINSETNMGMVTSNRQ